MLEGDLMEDDGRRWTLRLRENLWFHDGEPVRSRDCIASLKRWMVRDQGGVTLSQRLDAMEAPDDRTIVLRLNKPFPHLRTLLSKFIIPAVMMPERLALTDPFKQIPEAIGSGPFRWLADEHVLGSHAAFAKFDRYVPRDEPASYTAGGHRVLVDRVEWKMIPDGATATNALMTGEVDWIEIPLPDLLPKLKKTRGVTGWRAGHLRPDLFPAAQPDCRAHQQSGRSPRHAGRARPAGGDGRIDGRRSREHVHRRRLPADRQEGGGRGRHGTGAHAAYARSDQGDAGSGRLQRRAHRAAARHRSLVLQSDRRGDRARTVGRRHEHRRAGDGLGHRADPPHQPRTARQGRLVDVPVGRRGARSSRSAARQLHPRQRQGGLVRLAHRSEDRAALRRLARRHRSGRADAAGT